MLQKNEVILALARNRMVLFFFVFFLLWYSSIFAKVHQRIISLYAAHTENLFFLGLNNAIIGVSKRESSIIKKLNKPVFSFRDSAEKFIAANPDLVLFRPFIYRTHKNLVKKLEKSNITVIALQPRTVEEMFNYWLKLGKLTGKEKEALNMIDNFKKKVEIIKQEVIKKKPVKVFFESIHSKFYTFSKNSIANFVLTTAGGINVANDAKAIRHSNIAIYSKERIINKGDLIDVYIAQYGAMNHITKDKIINELGFRSIKAVKNRKIFIISEEFTSRPTPRLVEGIEKLLKILHPDIYQKLRRRNEF